MTANEPQYDTPTAETIHPDDFQAISRRYREMKTQQDAEQDAARKHGQERTAQRKALTPDFWRQRRTQLGELGLTTAAGEAWVRFRTAVLNGGDTVSAWVAYRKATTVASTELMAVTQYLYIEERNARATAIAEHEWLFRESGLLPSLHPTSGSMHAALPQDEYDARLTAYNARLAAYLGEHREPLDKPIGQRQITPPIGQDPIPPQDYSTSVKSYAEAIDAVTREAEQTAVTAAAAQRDADLETFLAERVP